MVDNGIIKYLTNIDAGGIIRAIETFFQTSSNASGSSAFFKNLKYRQEYKFINYISISTYRTKSKILISFSYSKIKKNDNYELCKNQKDVELAHSRIHKLLQVLTSEKINKKDLKVHGLDIANQIEFEKEKEMTVPLMILYECLNRREENATLYVVQNGSKKYIQGLSVHESGKSKRESNTYLRIYNKFRERKDTGRQEEGQRQSLRAELSLNSLQLKHLKIETLESVNKQKLDEVFKNVVGINFQKELKINLSEKLKIICKICIKYDKLKLIENAHKLADLKMLTEAISTKNTGTSERNCYYNRASAKKELEELEKVGDFAKTFKGNFERIEYLSEKLFKNKIKIDITGGEVVINGY